MELAKLSNIAQKLEETGKLNSNFSKQAEQKMELTLNNKSEQSETMKQKHDPEVIYLCTKTSKQKFKNFANKMNLK